MKYLPTIIIFVLAFGKICSGCGPSEDDYDIPVEKVPEPISNLTPYPALSQLNCPKGTHLTYKNFGSGFMRQFCTTCHSKESAGNARAGAPQEVNFDRSIDVQFFRAAILYRTKTDSPNAMPPGREIPKIEQSMLAEWLECGAPDKNK